MGKDSGLSVGLTDGNRVAAMVSSRQWWVFPGSHPIIEEVEARFSKERGKDFPTIMGSSPLGFFRVTFGKKSSMAKADLAVFLKKRGAAIPLAWLEEQDVLLFDEEGIRDAMCLQAAIDTARLEAMLDSVVSEGGVA